MPGWLWWVFVLGFIGVEMMTGTFYLLALAAAFAAGGIVDWLGFDWIPQLVVAGVVGAIGCLAAYLYQQKRRQEVKETPMTLDLNQRVEVLEWREDGTARVQYRGSQWDAVAASEASERRRDMVIVEVRGSLLVIDVASKLTNKEK